MRWAFLLPLLLVLGAQQVVSDLLVRRVAQPPSLVRFLPGRLPAEMPLLSAQRLVLVRDALADDDEVTAQRSIDELPPGVDRLDLMAELAERRGDERGALQGYLAADDLQGLERYVEHVDAHAAGDVMEAISIQSMVVGRLERARTQPDELADAWWRLGQLRAERGWREPPVRTTFWRSAAQAYDRALALAPLSQKYLLAAGYQALMLGENRQAEGLFARAREIDPANADALKGLRRAHEARG